MGGMTRPYYQDDYVTLYHGDCLTEHREWLEADVLVTDPPYGMNYSSTFGSVAGDASVVTRDQALLDWGTKPALVFGTWKSAMPSLVRQVMVWDKSGGGGLPPGGVFPWATMHEDIYIIGNWPKVEGGGRKREGGTPSRESGVIRVPQYNNQSGDRPDHPTPKPVPLMEKLLSKVPPGIIADPFAGSGSTLVAAKNLGRKVIGVEMEERYCEIMANRCQQEVLDLGSAA